MWNIFGMERSLDLQMCLAEDLSLARVITVERVVIPVPLILGINASYTCLDDGIAAR
jgi:hypothetical protein